MPEVDRAAIAANYHHLRGLGAPAECAAVVKADAYSLGLAPVVRTLLDCGCRTFFVAIGAGGDATCRRFRSVVAVFNGVLRSTTSAIEAFALTLC